MGKNDGKKYPYSITFLFSKITVSEITNGTKQNKFHHFLNDFIAQ